jgi:hypothetical protein
VDAIRWQAKSKGYGLNAQVAGAQVKEWDCPSFSIEKGWRAEHLFQHLHSIFQ